MKQTSVILLLGFFLWQTVGTFIYFQTNKYYIKLESQSHLTTSSKTQTIDLTPSEFKDLIWQNKKEFVYNSQLFDFISIFKKGNKISIKGFQDKKEENLNRKISKLIDSDSKKEKNDSSNSILIKIIKTPYLSQIGIHINPVIFNETIEIKHARSTSLSNYIVYLNVEHSPPI
jgi:hypothetical protein